METIFVSIPSYRDSICSNTLKELYRNADNPELVFAGVFEQNDPNTSNESCDLDNEKYMHNVRYKNVHFTEAKGPLYARNIIFNELYNNEKYILMIDAHTIFEKHWDTKMKHQLNYLQTKGVRKTNY